MSVQHNESARAGRAITHGARGGQMSSRASVLPKTDHCFFRDLPLLSGNCQPGLKTLAALHSLLLFPANDVVGRDTEVMGNLGTTLSRTLD